MRGVRHAYARVHANAGARTLEGVKEAAALLGPGIVGKVLVDATNPLSPWPELDVLWDGTSGEYTSQM